MSGNKVLRRAMNWGTRRETIEQVWVYCIRCTNEWLIDSTSECGCEEE